MFSIRKQRLRYGRKFARVSVVLICCAGFLYQTMSFLQYYRTYPTIVDIQQSSPPILDIPAFTICNPIGYNYAEFCTGFPCIKPSTLPIFRYLYCQVFPDFCVNGELPQDYRYIQYSTFILEELTVKDLDVIRIKLEKYMDCTIEIAGTVKSCNMENVMGSFYTRDELPQFCYTIYSVWGDVYKKRESIPKGATMKFSFHLNASNRNTEPGQLNGRPGPHNLPTSPFVQIAVHSPYFLPSPYLEGLSYKGGRSYELRVTMNEKHLLQSPYQTNCTDYLKTWKENGGRGPVNQLNVIQECRMKRWNSTVGCVSVYVDYPHNCNICGSTTTSNPNVTQLIAEDQCQMMADRYNQPCQSISYATTKKTRDIIIFKDIEVMHKMEKFRTTIPWHDCDDVKVWKPECSKIQIKVIFDRFEITNVTYNPRYESFELLSVLGGYIGIWLGISLVSIYDFIGSALGLVRKWDLKKKRRRIHLKKAGNVLFTRRRIRGNNKPRFI